VKCTRQLHLLPSIACVVIASLLSSSSHANKMQAPSKLPTASQSSRRSTCCFYHSDSRSTTISWRSGAVAEEESKLHGCGSDSD
jgi:hypothetical protein